MVTVAQARARLEAIEALHGGDLPLYVWDDWADFPVVSMVVKPPERCIIPGDGLERPWRVVASREES